MRFKTVVTHIDVDTGEVLNILPSEFKRDYDFVRRKDKTILKDNLCTIVYIFEGSKKNQLEINFNNNQNSL